MFFVVLDGQNMFELWRELLRVNTLLDQRHRYMLVYCNLLVQEAPLMLRGQHSRCRNIKGNPKYLAASLPKTTPTF